MENNIKKIVILMLGCFGQVAMALPPVILAVEQSGIVTPKGSYLKEVEVYENGLVMLTNHKLSDGSSLIKDSDTTTLTKLSETEVSDIKSCVAKIDASKGRAAEAKAAEYSASVCDVNKENEEAFIAAGFDSCDESTLEYKGRLSAFTFAKKGCGKLHVVMEECAMKMIDLLDAFNQ